LPVLIGHAALPIRKEKKRLWEESRDGCGYRGTHIATFVPADYPQSRSATNA
jgi:hypothetical protein